MKKATLFVICICAINITANAQELKLTDVYIYTGRSSSTASPYSTSTQSKLNAQFNMPSFTSDNNYGSNNYNYTSFDQTGIMVGLTLRKLPLRAHKIRLGISSSSYRIGWDHGAYQNKRYAYDTLRSSRTGNEVYIDSLHSKSRYYYHDAQSINFHAQYLRTINPRNKLSTYLGVGASFGVTMQNDLSANYNEFSYIQSPVAYQNNYYPSKSLSQTESLEAIKNFGASTLIGINYRFSNRTPILRNTNIFAEGNLGLDYRSANDGDADLGFIRGVNVGLRVSLDNPRNYKRKK